VTKYVNNRDMRKTDPELNRERRNQKLEAALHCYLQFGYSKTSMDDVASKQCKPVEATDLFKVQKYTRSAFGIVMTLITISLVS
jgi:hypothetical protein